MNEYKLVDIKEGDNASFCCAITKEMEDSFRKISGDENPLHKNDSYAFEISGGKYQHHISFGMLTAALYSTLAGMYLPGKYSLIHSFDELSFLKPVFVGDELKIEGVVYDLDVGLKMIRVKAQIQNQNDKIVSRAKMKILVLK